jgi:hypothetical protein
MILGSNNEWMENDCDSGEEGGGRIDKGGDREKGGEITQTL